MNKDDNFNSILQILTGNSIGADRSIFLQNAVLSQLQVFKKI